MKMRLAKREDAQSIYTLLQALAKHEGSAKYLQCNKEELENALFTQKLAKAVVLQRQDSEKSIIGFAIFYVSFASFLGSGSIKLENLYILPQFRKRGYAKKIFKYLISLCQKKGYKRIEWICLSNNKDGLAFYNTLKSKHFKKGSFYSFYYEI